MLSFSGLAPGFSGLWQVNAVVPANVSSGAANLIITVNNVASNTATIAVN
jgi:uncharacterized protein (TIGR03437 family)